MGIAPFTTFAAGFTAGGIALGAVVALARLTSVNGQIAGVPPKSGGSMFWVTRATSSAPFAVWFGKGPGVTAPGGVGYGVELRCPA